MKCTSEGHYIGTARGWTRSLFVYRCARPGYTARNVLTGPPKQKVESLGTYHESLGTYQKYEGYGLLHRTLQPFTLDGTAFLRDDRVFTHNSFVAAVTLRVKTGAKKSKARK